jgi:hypothetical protein
MPPPLINVLTKTPLPDAPIAYEGSIPVVPGNASVPVELRVTGVVQQGPVGVDIVFVIDNSGSMGPDPPHSDPQQRRFTAIYDLIDAFAPTRDALDRIAIVTFQGGRAQIDEPNTPWKSWSAIGPRIQSLMNSGPAGATPMADAMRKADALLANSNGFYRLAILLSDGLPTPDDDTNPQTTTIVEDIIPNECIPNRIIYSTIYLYTAPPEDNALLAYIARQTDYITQYLPGDMPAYYFRITSPNEIVAKYRALFDTASSRLVPQDLYLSERVNSRLVIDPDAPVTFSGSGFIEDQNLLGGIPLGDLIEHFRGTNLFQVHLNEVDGEVVFRFSVKLNLESVTDVEYSNGYVYVDVDVLAESLIAYLEPNVGAGTIRASLGLPQARIKFVLGLQVTKTLDIAAGSVRIDVANLDSRTVTQFQLAECPSTYANVADISDDFGFHPFDMLYEERILPWFLHHIPIGSSVHPQALQAIAGKVKTALRTCHAPVLDRANELDRYFCQFGFTELKPGNHMYDAFWNTPHQRGIYKAILELGAKASRSLSFQIGGASYLLSSGIAEMLSTPADALETKLELPMSKYKATSLNEWKRLLPNPSFYQIVSATAKPDLFLRTCFSIEHLDRLMALLLGRPLDNAWAILDSPDITPIWRPALRHGRIGLSVILYNAGECPSSPTQLRARSIFLPYTGEEIRQPINPAHPYEAFPPFFGSIEVQIPSIAARSQWSTDVVFGPLCYLRTGASAVERVDLSFLLRVRDAIVISTVDVAATAQEKLLNNNSAIEMVPLS